MSNIDLRMTSVRPMSKAVVGKGCKEYTIFIDSIHLSRLKTLATRTSPASVMMNKKRVRFASHAQVCAVTRLEDPTLGNVRLSYSREEYDGFKRGVVRDVQLFRFRRRKGFPVDNRVTFFTETTTVGIEQTSSWARRSFFGTSRCAIREMRRPVRGSLGLGRAKQYDIII